MTNIWETVQLSWADGSYRPGLGFGFSSLPLLSSSTDTGVSSGQQLVVHFANKERCPEVYYTSLWAMANTWLNIKRFGRNMIEKLVLKGSGGKAG